MPGFAGKANVDPALADNRIHYAQRIIQAFQHRALLNVKFKIAKSIVRKPRFRQPRGIKPECTDGISHGRPLRITQRKQSFIHRARQRAAADERNSEAHTFFFRKSHHLDSEGHAPARQRVYQRNSHDDAENTIESAVGRITPQGAIKLYLVTYEAYPTDIAAGPDGNLWFTEPGQTRTGRITPRGAITEYQLPTIFSFPEGITPGPDGNLWFTEYAADQIGRITTGGIVTEYPTPSPSTGPWNIAAGPDGNVWFTEADTNKIGRITTSGVFLPEYPIPTTNGRPLGISAGPDGNMWLTEINGNTIGQITSAGLVTEYQVPTPGSSPVSIAEGPDANLWFTETDGNKIGRITDTPRPTLSLNPSSGPPGTVTDATGTRFGSFETVKLSFVDSINGRTAMGKVETDSSGQFSIMVTIPLNATLGRQQVLARGLTSKLMKSAPFRVT